VEAAEAPLLALGYRSIGPAPRTAAATAVDTPRRGQPLAASSSPAHPSAQPPARPTRVVGAGAARRASLGCASARPGCVPLEAPRVLSPTCTGLCRPLGHLPSVRALCRFLPRGEGVERCARRTSRSPLHCAVAPGYTIRCHRGACFPPAAAATATVRSLQWLWLVPVWLLLPL